MNMSSDEDELTTEATGEDTTEAPEVTSSLPTTSFSAPLNQGTKILFWLGLCIFLTGESILTSRSLVPPAGSTDFGRYYR